MTVHDIETTYTETFGDRMMGILNDSHLALMISVGYRTGLFDALATVDWVTSDALAARMGLNERYVREWLGAMAAGRIVDYRADTKSFCLPPEHATSLTRAAGADNLAPFMQYISVLGSVEDDIVECFRHGGGVPYSRFERFQEVMAEDSGQSVLPALIDSVLPLVPGLSVALERGIEVLDVGCGSGRALNLMARTYPASGFLGYDISEQGIEAGWREATELGLWNVAFSTQDAAQMRDEERFDLIMTLDAIHDQRDPVAVVRNIRRALRPGGVYLMQDIRSSVDLEKNLAHPAGPFLYTISTMHCMTVSLALDGAGYGAMWGEEKALELLHDAGFSSVEVHQLPHDFQNSWYVCRA